ncbi:MAG: hypothetical protein ACI3T9_05025 [Romboutsia timonensis]
MIDRYLKYEKVIVKRVMLDDDNPKAILDLREQYEYVKIEQLYGGDFVLAYINLSPDEQVEEKGIKVDIYNLELAELMVKDVALELVIPEDEVGTTKHKAEVQVILMK